MGCAQPQRTILPQNQIPIERIHDDRAPLIRTSPMFVPTVPSPPFVKSALKKDHFNGGRLTNPSPLFRQDPLTTPKSVNFYQTVQVRCRTPTPNKIWYEKSSTTMPMRKTLPNDDDDDDYEAPEENDDDENDDDEQQQISRIPRLGTPLPSQTNRQWFPNNSFDENDFSRVNRIKVRQRVPSATVTPTTTFIPVRPSFPLSTNIVAPSDYRSVSTPNERFT